MTPIQQQKKKSVVRAGPPMIGPPPEPDDICTPVAPADPLMAVDKFMARFAKEHHEVTP
jgi:hypothetical protein